MAAQEQLQRCLQLAHKHEQAGQFRERDRCLELALHTAWQAGKVSEAERIWKRLRQSNPHHFLGAYESLSQAMERPEVREYLANVQCHANEWLADPMPAKPMSPGQGCTTMGELVLPLETSLMGDSGNLPENAAGELVTNNANPSSTGLPQTIKASASESLLDRSDQARAAPAAFVGGAVPPSVRSAQVPPRRMAVSDQIHAEEPAASLPDPLSMWIAGSLAVLLALLAALLASYVLFSPFLGQWFWR
ncbi:hypothetical protein HRbin36_00772 [bacterium HR36]|nr:hypothetical protein HRbin36_00772 [bacterium HR36]